MAAGLLSLREIAMGSGLTYPSVARLAKQYGWRVMRPANRTLGKPALYNADAVRADLIQREQDKAA